VLIVHFNPSHMLAGTQLPESTVRGAVQLCDSRTVDQNAQLRDCSAGLSFQEDLLALQGEAWSKLE
jgi:hypothetical protein